MQLEITDPLNDGGKFYGTVPERCANEGTIETGGSDPSVSGLIAHYERQGYKITRAAVNRIEHPDGHVGWAVTLYYLNEDGLPDYGDAWKAFCAMRDDYESIFCRDEQVQYDAVCEAVDAAVRKYQK